MTVTKIINTIALLVVSLLNLVCYKTHAKAQEGLPIFTHIDANDGLSDNRVQHIIQLPSSAMAITTAGNINIYDGSRFTYIHRNPEEALSIPEYNGAYRVYVGKDDKLWGKVFGKAWCFDLKIQKYLSPDDKFWKGMGGNESIKDFFIDKNHNMWIKKDGYIVNSEKTDIKINIRNKEKAELQDLEKGINGILLFFDNTEVWCADPETGKIVYKRKALDEKTAKGVKGTSLTVSDRKGKIYQLRTGHEGSVCLVFDEKSRQWHTVMAKPFLMHTLIVSKNGRVFITCGKGIWSFINNGEDMTYYPAFNVAGSGPLETDINTIYEDNSGGLWLGTVNRGLFYAHPDRLKFISTIQSPFETGLFDYNSITGANDVPKNLRWNDTEYIDIIKDCRGWLWGGTPDGIHLYKKGDKLSRIIHTEDGLANNFIHSLYEDSKGRIWVATSNGISCIYIKDNDIENIVSFDSNDGTLQEEYRDRGIKQVSDGTLIFEGQNGWTYFHPDSVRIATHSFRPVLTSVAVDGQKMETEKGLAPSFVDKYDFHYPQSTPSFQFSAMNFAQPQHTYYRYRLVNKNKGEWITTSTSSPGGEVDKNGTLRLSFIQLPFGEYKLQVMASTNPDIWDTDKIKEISFTMHAPWWLSTWAYIIYIILTTVIITTATILYIRYKHKKIVQKHKEEILIQRIKNLIERCNEYEKGLCCIKEEETKYKEEKQKDIKENKEENNTPTIKKEECTNINDNKETNRNRIANKKTNVTSDNDFIRRAMSLVEQNLNTPGYSVEQLSKDLCMERTGLYKKLTLMLDQSPSVFIRSIRLRKAAELLEEGRLSITEIAEKVGFNSTSYMSKCFQEEFGCRPSEYTSSKNNTEETV